jgi:molybdopterin molybdotransferase
MIGFAEARALVLAAMKPLGREHVALERAAGRYLAVAVRAPHASPRFDQSMMDGYAVRAADLASPLSADLVADLAPGGEIPAGTVRVPTLRPGSAIKVFTGGRLPRGADAVVMVEHTAQVGGRVRIVRAVPAGANIRRAGEEFRRGEPVLAAGQRVTPAVIGLLASFGRRDVAVARRPRVALITMGDELVACGEPLAPGRIHDANGPALAAALAAAGAGRVKLRLVRDSRAALRRALAAAIEGADLVVTVGGASVGDHDHVEAARADLGLRERFHRVAIQPGKPNHFGLAPDGTPVFGLPGNPVSALVACHLFVRPALLRLMGAEPTPDTLPVRLAEPVRKPAERALFLRGRLEIRGDGLWGVAGPRQGSHMLSGLTEADILIELPSGATAHHVGDVVLAHVLPR